MRNSEDFNILFVGDIIGRLGRKAAAELMPKLKQQLGINFTVANCENVAGGFGLTPRLVEEIKDAGVDVLTSGNHIWDRKEVVPHLDSLPDVLRPANYPEGVPGRGWGFFETKDGMRICVVNLMGRVFMRPIDCPFRSADKILARAKDTITIVDMHAEATSEKIAMGWYLDGKVTAVVGTHTHVQTADERVLPGGTAYITDVGMTGPFDSVIGIDKEVIMERFLTGIPRRFEPATKDIRLSGVLISVDTSTLKARRIERIQLEVDLGDQ
jgi:metallophosphoesterase (TIGR00282 family)